MISYGDMLDVVEAEEKKNAPATVEQMKKAETKKEEKEEIEDVIEDGDKEEEEENEN